MNDYKDYGQISNARKNLQHGVRIAFFLHKRLIKPKFPILYRCPNCGRPVFEANSDTIELTNSFGVDQQSIRASDSWIRVKCHSCAAHISILWR